MPLALEEAALALSTTAGLGEVIHPYKGGSHVFRYEEEGGPDGKGYTFLDLGGETYGVDLDSFISAVKKVPGGCEAMVNKWPPYMIVEPLNYFFDKRDGDFKAITQGSEIITFTRPDSTMFNPERVLSMMADAVAQHSGHDADNIQVDNFFHGLSESGWTVVDPEGARFIEARPGDRTLGGLGFNGSLLGLKPMELTVRTRRVICDNGMVGAASTTKFKVGGEDEEAEGGIDHLEEWLRTETAGLFTGSAMDEEFARLTHLTHQTVDDVHLGNTMEDLFQRFRVPVGARSEVLEALEIERDGTMYGIVQAFTRAAQHSTAITEGVRDRLMRDAGEISLHAQAICDSCQRVL